MILKIDTTKREEVKVALGDLELVQKQKLGSQVLLPMIVKILKRQKLNFSDLSAIEVNPGPGSFTGTRIGVTVANVLGYILDIPVNGPLRRSFSEASKKGKIVIPKYEKSKFG